ncbi:MAG: hypothetical protein R3F59_31540 [Myxococcota bacterium]
MDPAVTVLWFTLAGCGGLQTFDPAETHRGLTYLDETSTAGDDDDDAPDLDCVDDQAGAGAPITVQRATDGAGDDIAPSCIANNGGEDYVLSWTAPNAGSYVFDLAGSDFDTTLMLADSCTGDELACNDDWLPGGISQVVVDVDAGQTLVVVVDGHGRNSRGDFSLNVDPLEDHELDCEDGRDLDGDGSVDCDDPDCSNTRACTLDCADGLVAPPFPIEVALSTVGESDDTDPSCQANSSAPDAAIQFTVPTGGSYTFSTDGSDFDTVLYILDGCGGRELACDDDSGAGLQSQLSVSLQAGQTVLAVIDGYSSNAGEAVLTVTRD